MTRHERLDIALLTIRKKITPMSRSFLSAILKEEYKDITDETLLEDEIDLLVETLKDDDFITEEEDLNQVMYQVTQSGIDYLNSGGYTADDAENSKQKKQKEKKADTDLRNAQNQSIFYIPSILISVVALLVSIGALYVNTTKSGNNSKIEKLEMRLDSLEKVVGMQQATPIK